MLAATLAVWIGMEISRAFQRRAEATSQDRGSLLVLRLCGALGALVAVLAITRVRAATYSAGPVGFSAGLIVMWAGIGLRWWSFRSLGRYFTFTVMTSPDQPVIARGPYQVIRHPGYAGLLLTLLGVGLTYGNWLSLAGLVLLPLIGVVNRIRVEEAALSVVRGEAYRSYAAGRKRLIPFVW